MELVNKWLSKPFKVSEFEKIINEINASNPYLEVAECALSLGIDELYNLSIGNLNEAENLILELISLRKSGEINSMFNNIDTALEIVRKKESRDLVLEGRLRMELGLIKVQTNSKDDPHEDFDWAMKRLSSVSTNSRLHGLSIINKAAYHEHVNENLMALHLYGEIPLKGDFPVEIIGFSRIGAARIMMSLGNSKEACRHLYNAHNLFKNSNNIELAWHSGFEFLKIGTQFVDINAQRMNVQVKNSKPMEVGDEKPVTQINPLDLKEIAINLKKSEEIYSNVDESIKEFIDQILEHSELL